MHSPLHSKYSRTTKVHKRLNVKECFVVNCLSKLGNLDIKNLFPKNTEQKKSSFFND